MKTIFAVLTTLVLVGCSSVPDELASDNEEALVSYKVAKHQGNEVEGEPARWGGVIADVRNAEDHTVLEVVSFPLKRWGRPEVSDNSDGRFLAVINDFVDPDVYQQGRAISFVGTIGQTQQGKIDEYVYTYPVIEATGYHLWKVEKQKSHVEVDYSPLWFRHNFYSPYYPYRYPVPVRFRVQDNSGTPAKNGN
ncbi:Slp family lipoprotein [Idiomarina sp. PL1-037]|uniref:Slp family lipoprotein n=1 Tax=Idiomarina sp. PL1-037 TaxID=3095365 RepID=UPI002ACC19DA|nr:Slp family lipoprotein [Idiomarina sp. PL1-037]WQC52251.1 Slp family lipoprotein [Idiomarina sp. PL1-037]